MSDMHFPEVIDASRKVISGCDRHRIDDHIGSEVDLFVLVHRDLLLDRLVIRQVEAPKVPLEDLPWEEILVRHVGLRERISFVLGLEALLSF